MILLTLLWSALAAHAATDCLREEGLRALLPAARAECRHVSAVAGEFRERFSEITKHCELMRKVSGGGKAITKAKRNQLVAKLKDLFEPPSLGNVVIASMPETCMKDRDAIYAYRREAIASFQPLIQNLTHLANDRDPLRR